MLIIFISIFAYYVHVCMYMYTHACTCTCNHNIILLTYVRKMYTTAVGKMLLYIYTVYIVLTCKLM